jgi:hypothetical protein
MTILFAVSVKAQEEYKTEYNAAGDKVLIGRINEKMLANDSAFMWFFTGVNRYRPDTEWTKYISFYRDSFDIVAFAGTWCPDTKRLLPQFYRVMMASSYPMNRIKLYGLDEQKHGLGDVAQQYDIDKVPTIILLHQGKEIGRIEENVHRSIEADMVSILQKVFSPEQQPADSTSEH